MQIKVQNSDPAVIKRRMRQSSAASAAPAATVQRALATRSALSVQDVLHLQRTMGNRSVQQLLARQTGTARSGASDSRATGSLAPALFIQRVKDFASAGVPNGTGLTPSKAGPHGKWHIHVIRDDEGLGLIEKVFIRFEERVSAQHLMFDRDGKIQSTALYEHGPKLVVEWGQQTVADFLKTCTDVSPEEIVQRRKAKADKEARDREALAKLPPIKGAEKHEYSGAQANLFGSSTVAVSDEKACEMLAKAGITPKNNKDFNMIKAKVKEGLPKEKWPAFIRDSYDQVFPPVLTQMETEVASEVDKQNTQESTPAPTNTTGDLTAATTNQTATETPQKPLEGAKIAEVVRQEIQQPRHTGGLQGALIQYGVPIALVLVILAVVLRFFL